MVQMVIYEGVSMKKLFGLLTIIIAVSVFNVCAMEPGENVAPVVLTAEELSRRLQQQRQERQEAARRRRIQARQAGGYVPQNLNTQFGEHAENAGDMDVEF